MNTRTAGGNKNGNIDWMCVARYVLYGALMGGLFADWIVSPGAVSVYGGAVVGGLLLGAAKLVILQVKQ